MDNKSPIETVKEKMRLVVVTAKTRLFELVEVARIKPKKMAEEAKTKLGPMVEDAKAKQATLTSDAKTKFTTIKGQAETVHEHPKVQSYVAKLKQKEPLTLGGTIVVGIVCVWFAFNTLSDKKPSDQLLFDTVTADGGNGVVYDTKILARDGYEDGANKYVVEVEYEITWKMDQDKALEVMMELAYKQMKADGLPEYQIKMALMFGGMSVALSPLLGEKPFKAGDRQKMTDVYTFAKAESGWRVVNDDPN